MIKKLTVKTLFSICFVSFFSCSPDISYKQMEEQVGKITCRYKNSKSKRLRYLVQIRG